jgi:hypothetical protein
MDSSRQNISFHFVSILRCTFSLTNSFQASVFLIDFLNLFLMYFPLLSYISKRRNQSIIVTNILIIVFMKTELNLSLFLNSWKEMKKMCQNFELYN